MEGEDGLASEWKYISVRRTALFLEESLYRGTEWVVFEPNEEPLWAQIRLEVGAFMHELYRKGAFPGATPHRAYFVKCDAETTTQNDIERGGIVNILVGFAPLQPAEFVIIRIEQVAGRKRKEETVPRMQASSLRLDPYRKFRFRVKWQGRYVAGASKLRALRHTTEVMRHTRTRSSPPPTSPGRSEYEAITLEHGVTYDKTFERWAQSGSREDPRAAGTSLEDIVIEEYDEAGQLAVIHKLSRCWVSEFQALPELDANANAVAIQSIELAHEGWDREIKVPEPNEQDERRAST